MTMSFVPELSTDSIWYRENMSRCLSDHLDELEGYIETLEDGKADADHTHTEYAAANHTHTGYAAASHTHTGYAATNHTHTAAAIGAAPTNHTHDYAATSHTHSQTEIEGLGTALNGKAAADHTHSGYAATNHTHTDYAAADHTHSGYAASNHTHTGYAAADHTHSRYAASSHTHTAASIGAAAASHNHDSAYIKKGLQMTADDGNVYASWSGKDVVAQIKALATGMYTAYCNGTATNIPKSGSSFRFLIHKTGATYG